MKVLHINAGLENGGGLYHIINLLSAAKMRNKDYELLTLAEGPVKAAAEEAKIKVTSLESNSRYDIKVFRRLIDYINQNNFDIVHTHGPRANLFLYLIHKKIKAKWVVTVHSDPLLDFANKGLIGKIFTKLNILALRHADQIFAITQRFADLFTDQVKIDPKKIIVIYNGIFFKNQIPVKLTHDKFNIINVARCEKIKGQDLLLKALHAADDQRLMLHIAGDGSQLPRLKELAKELKLEDQVIFHGFLSHTELTKLYQKMDLAVLSSYSESFPLVLLEAGDNELPLLSTTVGDIKKLIPDDEYGFIVNIGDEVALSDQLVNISKLSKKQLQMIAKKEKKYLANTFSIYNQLAEIDQGYQLLMK